MVSGLHQANRADALLACTLEHGLHQLATNGLVLHVCIHRDRTHPCNRVTLPKKVTAGHAPIPFRDDGVNVGSGQQMADEVGCMGRTLVHGYANPLKMLMLAKLMESPKVLRLRLMAVSMQHGHTCVYIAPIQLLSPIRLL